MTERQWNCFTEYREALKNLCEEWNEMSGELFPLQKEACKKDTPDYNLETAVVYNTAYDDIAKSDEIHYIVIGDNPGKDEQKVINRKYLVGQSGKIAQGFFRKNPELDTDFRKNVIISNKTPLHTAKTKHLKFLEKEGSEKVRNLILESQTKLAEMTAVLHQGLIDGMEEGSFRPELWLVGYAELKNRGIFVPYREALKAAYMEGDCAKDSWNSVKVYQHFSMNRFTIDLKDYRTLEQNKAKDLKTSLDELGTLHRKEIFSL